MAIENALASLAVRDMKTSMVWYEKLFGRPADSVPMFEVAEWYFKGGGGLQVYGLPERAGKGSCTLIVDDLDDAIDRAESLGADTALQSHSPTVRTLMIQDPDGNHIAFAQPFNRMA